LGKSRARQKDRANEEFENFVLHHVLISKFVKKTMLLIASLLHRPRRKTLARKVCFFEKK
jgi:hypothetical protein